MDKNRLKEQLIIDEGLVLDMYRCTAGKNTIGVGHNLDDNPLTNIQLRYLGIPENSSNLDVINIISKKGVNKDWALFVLDNDIDVVFNQLKKAIPWIVDKPDEIQEALCNMCFNLGIRGLLAFKKTLAYIKDNEYEKASVELMDSKWAKQVGARSQRISDLIKNSNT